VALLICPSAISSKMLPDLLLFALCPRASHLRAGYIHFRSDLTRGPARRAETGYANSAPNGNLHAAHIFLKAVERPDRFSVLCEAATRAESNHQIKSNRNLRTSRRAPFFCGTNNCKHDRRELIDTPYTTALPQLALRCRDPFVEISS